MLARVKSDFPLPATTACGGLEFVKSEFRPVPTHEEASARANADLEIREELVLTVEDGPKSTETVGQIPGQIEQTIPEPEKAPAASKGKGKSRPALAQPAETPEA